MNTLIRLSLLLIAVLFTACPLEEKKGNTSPSRPKAKGLVNLEERTIGGETLNFMDAKFLPMQSSAHFSQSGEELSFNLIQSYLSFSLNRETTCEARSQSVSSQNDAARADSTYLDAGRITFGKSNAQEIPWNDVRGYYYKEWSSQISPGEYTFSIEGSSRVQGMSATVLMPEYLTGVTISDTDLSRATPEIYTNQNLVVEWDRPFNIDQYDRMYLEFYSVSQGSSGNWILSPIITCRTGEQDLSITPENKVRWEISASKISALKGHRDILASVLRANIALVDVDYMYLPLQGVRSRMNFVTVDPNL